MSLFATKKEKDDEDSNEDAAASSSSASSSSARETSSSSWFGVDMSSMQNAIQAGIADFQDAINEQVEEVMMCLYMHIYVCVCLRI